PTEVSYEDVYRGRSVSDVGSNIDDAPGDRRGRSHRRTHQVSAASPALASLEIPVRGRRTPLTRTQHIVVHAETHRASGIAPLEPCIREDLMQSFLLGLGFHPYRPWHYQSAHASGDLTA